MDQQIDELKELVRQNIAISTETNKLVHSMRAGARWAGFFRFVWWGVILAGTVASYFYLLPYITKIEDLYASMQSGAQQAQSFPSQVLSTFQNIVPKSQ